MSTVDVLLQDLAADARRLEADPALVATSVRRAHAPRSRPRRPARRSAVAFAAVLVAAVLAAPVTVAGIGDAVQRIFDTPGGELTGKHIPSWIGPGVHDARTVAGKGRDRLIAYSDEADWYCFNYGDAVGECSTAGDWKKELAEQPVLLRGPTPRNVLYGFTTGDITHVRLDYKTGPPTLADSARGGFALVADRSRDPQRLAALDATGRTVTTLNVDDRGWRWSIPRS